MKMPEKKVIIGVAAAVLMVGIGAAALAIRESGGKAQEMEKNLKTEEIQVRTIEKNLSATGTIVSNQTKTESVALSNYEVGSVLVSAGDVVKKGDLLFTLKLDSIEQALALEEQNLKVGEAKNGINIQTARRQLDDSVAGKNQQAITGNKAIGDAGENYVKSAQELLVLEQKLSDARKQEAEKLTGKNAEERNYNDQKKKFDEKNQELQKRKIELEKAQARVGELEGRVSSLKNAGQRFSQIRQVHIGEAGAWFAEAESGMEPEPEKQPEAEAGKEAEATAEAEAGKETEPITEPEAGKETEPITEPEAGKETEVAAETETGKETETEKETAVVQPDENREELQRQEEKLKRAKTEYQEILNRVNDLQLQLIPLEGSYSTAKSNYETALTAYNEAVNVRKALEDSLKSVKNQKDSAENAYENTVLEKSDAIRQSDSAVKAQEENLNRARLDTSNNMNSVKKDVKKYEEELKKGNVTASIAGIVTAVNVRQGEVYTGGPVVTIEDTASYQVSTVIDEADISDLKEGMRVRIKTEATQEEELEGTITFLSPTPVKAAGEAAKAAVARATYEVKIAIHSHSDRLRLGMTAKLNIILDSRENVLTVPASVIKEDEKGQSSIQIVETGKDEPVTVPVTKGMEGDYYLEIISDKIKKGMKVVIPEEQGTGSPEEMIENMGLMYGM